jgi:hypothetical protein
LVGGEHEGAFGGFKEAKSYFPTLAATPEREEGGAEVLAVFVTRRILIAHDFL